MDWASSLWKQELPPSAIQKINALEEKIDRLLKERQQKQLQCDCLELALEKEKRKVGENVFKYKINSFSVCLLILLRSLISMRCSSIDINNPVDSKNLKL